MNKDELFEFSIGLLNEVHDYEKEIQKLNNIIDELESYLEQQYLDRKNFRRIKYGIMDKK